MKRAECGLLRRARMRAAMLVFLASSALGSAAQAQTQINTLILEFPGRAEGSYDLEDLASVTAVPIREAECDTAITFRFADVDMTRANLMFFSGTMCNDPTVRTDNSTMTCDPMYDDDGTTILQFPIESATSVDHMINVDDLVPCGGTTSSGTVTVWVLALNNTSDTVTANGQYDTFTIAYDFAPPEGPADFEGSGGENSVTLTWDGGSGDEEYEVYLDPSGCPSTALTDPPDPALRVATFMGPADSYTLMWPDSVMDGATAAIAIRAIDGSGNEGPLSAVICVTRVEGTSWCDTAPDMCTGTSCAASPRGRSFLAPIAAIALALLFLQRRRR